MVRSRKIRFIEPHGRPARPFNAWISRWPLLGPITLATILDERGYDVSIYNENISGPVDRNPEGYQDVCSADVVGISIMTPTASRGYAIAEGIRREAPGVKIVFGGVHATFLPHEALAHGDVVVRGEGENVIEAIAGGEIGSGIVSSPPLEDLDSLPALNHFLMRDVEKLMGRRGAMQLYELPVMTSRGCPYGCTYCTVTRMFGRRVRRQSADKVYSDIRRYAERGFRHLFFYDDNFITDRSWARDLLARLAPMRMRFNAQTRVDFGWMDASRRRRDEALLRAMHRAGGDVLYVGYETVEDATAAQWQKGYRGPGALEDRLREDTQILHQNGFWIHGMFVLGPQHTRSSADRIVDFARRSGIESLQISILTPFPGTPLLEQMRPHLLFDEFPSDWDYYDGAHCTYDHARLGVEGLQRAVLDAHRRFYSWGGWSTRRLRAFLEQPIPPMAKLAQLWSNAHIARSTLRAWRRETKSFIQLARRRIATALSAQQSLAGGAPPLAPSASLTGARPGLR